MKIEVTQLKEINFNIVTKINNLISQLTNNFINLNEEDLLSIVNSDNVKLFVSKVNKKICGLVCVIYYNTPTAKKARIEDLVVNANFRGNGIGELLIERCIHDCKLNKINYIDLTSKPERIAANNLYKKMQFSSIKTNVYRYFI